MTMAKTNKIIGLIQPNSKAQYLNEFTRVFMAKTTYRLAQNKKTCSRFRCSTAGRILV